MEEASRENPGGEDRSHTNSGRLSSKSSEREGLLKRRPEESLDKRSDRRRFGEAKLYVVVAKGGSIIIRGT